MVFDVKADKDFAVPTIRLSLQLTHTVRSVKEKLAAVGLKLRRL